MVFLGYSVQASLHLDSADIESFDKHDAEIRHESAVEQSLLSHSLQDVDRARLFSTNILLVVLAPLAELI